MILLNHIRHIVNIGSLIEIYVILSSARPTEGRFGQVFYVSMRFYVKVHPSC
jgi:hypothetical protein